MTRPKLLSARPSAFPIHISLSSLSSRVLLGLWLAAVSVYLNPPDVATAQPARTPIELDRLTGAIDLDGHITESAWDAIDPLPLVMYGPTYKGTITERTEIRIGYDDEHIYVSGRLYHSDISNLRANSLYRDRWSGDETFAVLIDSFNDNENALWFYVMPLCTRSDLAISDDAALGRRSQNEDWNTFWDAACTITDEGWFAEMRIPFTSLGFQSDGERVEMGITTYRWMTNNHRYIYPDIPPEWDRGFTKPSLAQDVILRDIERRNPIYVTPYGLGGTERLPVLNDSETEYEGDITRTGEFGLDVKYSLTSNLTLDATYNTDFAQVEADDQQINLTRFSLFFPEKRRFFQERSGIFEFGTGAGGTRLFHSRRIGLANGRPIPMLGGGRFVGRVGKWDLGLVNLQTDAQGVIPSENFGVARLRRNVLNPLSTVGGILTTRVAEDGGRNLAWGFDTILNVTGEEFLTIKVAQTSDHEAHDDHDDDHDHDESSFDLLESSHFLLNWQRRNISGWSYDLDFIRSGENYNPEVGFIRRNGYTYVSPDFEYQSFKGEDSRFRRIWWGNWTYIYWQNESRDVETSWIHPFWFAETKNGATLLLSTEHWYESVASAFSLSPDVEVLADDYSFQNIWLAAGPPDAWYFRPNLTLRSGTFYDGWKSSIQASSNWNLSKHLELAPGYELNVIRFGHRDQKLTTHLARLRIQAAANSKLSATAFLQYNTLRETFNINARLRYNAREGNDLWIVYDEGINTSIGHHEGHNHIPLPRSARRALLIKYSHTFIW